MRKRRLLLSVSLLAWVVILGTSSENVHAKQIAEFAVSDSSTQDQSNAEYRIKPTDLLDIRIEGACIFNPTFEVDDQGMIQMIFIDEVQAADRTAIELENDIAAKLAEYLKNPKVHIRVIRRRTSQRHAADADPAILLSSMFCARC